MKIISPKQCRAARGLVDITRGELAEMSGVAVGTIGAFENETVETRTQAVTSLRLALENAGVEFLDGDGIKTRSDHVRMFTGKNAHRQLLDEVYSDMKEVGGEILIKGLDESRWESGDDAAFLKHHIDRLLKAGVTERLLVSDKFPLVVTHKHWYRTIPDQYFSPYTHWIFAGKVAMVFWGDVEKVIILESQALFDSMSKEFDCIWDNVGKPLD